jgi:hypothetical protein
MRKSVQKLVTIICSTCILTPATNAQITGGQNAFEFLRMSNSPHVSALGGYVPASRDNDVTFTLQNPSLLRPSFHNQLALSYNLYYANIGIAQLQYAYHVASLNTDFGFGIQYYNYGSFKHTDWQGIDMGSIRASDYSINFSASRQYKERWRYGATLKWANSNLGDRSAMALLADVGISYHDTVKKWTIGIVAKNMGVMLKQYNPNNPAEPLPFDLQIGISKELENVPLRLFLVGHHLYEWDIRYNNPADKVDNSLIQGTDTTEKSSVIDKFFRHINIGAEVLLGKRITVSAAYNHIRRSELAAGDAKGLAGFSFGASINLNKWNVRYARSYMATAGAYNEFGLSLQLNKFFNIGKKTSAWGWDASY